MSRPMRFVKSILVTAIVALTVPTAVRAQLEEVVVTAQKRAQSLQDVSLAVTAVEAERLRDNQVISIEDLQYIAPSISFGNVLGFAKVFVRGIGLNDQTAGIDPSVAVHVDGAVINDPTAHFTSLFDVDRVEVLRGPQGTLYGRNATGGSLNIITAKPTRELEAYARATAGNYNLLLAEGALSGPLSEKLSARLAFRVNTHDGYGINEVTGNDVDDADQKGARLHLKFDFTEAMDVLLSGEYYEEDDHALGLKFLRESFPQYAADPSLTPAQARALAPLGLGGFPTGERNFASEFDPQNKKETWSVTSTYSWRLNDRFTLVDIANYREVEGTFIHDLDMSAVVNRPEAPPVGTGNFPTIQTRFGNSDQISNELQLQCECGKLTGLAALYYFTQNLSGDNRSGLTPTGDVPGLPQQRVVLQGESEADSWSAFMHWTYNLNEQFAFKLGGRYTSETRSIENRNTVFIFVPNGAGGLVLRPPPLPNPTITLLSSKESFDAFTPLGGVEWRPSNRMMLYYTYSEGFKSGVGLLGQTVSGIARPETIENHEIGLKSTWLDDRALLNLAVFTYDLQDLQLGRTIPAGGGGAGFVNRFENAAEVEASGAEVEALWRATDRLTLAGSVAWLDVEFAEFDTVDLFDVNNVLNPSAVPVQSWAGNRPRNSPEWAYNLHGEQEIPLGASGALTLAADVSYKSEQFFSEFNNDLERVGAYTLVDAHLTYKPVDARWALSFWGKNLTDELVEAGTFAVSLTRAVGRTYLPPRTYGVTFDYTF
jgi:iron complex outermembrane recepter protein